MMQNQRNTTPEKGTKESFELALTEFYIWYGATRSEERADKFLGDIRAYVDQKDAGRSMGLESLIGGMFEVCEDRK